MLVLTRKCNEAIVIGGSNGFDRLLKVTVVEVRGGKVRLGIEVAEDIPVHRWEVWQRICAEKNQSPKVSKNDAALPGFGGPLQ